MKFEETERGFRLSFGRQMADLQKLKMHFFLGFISAMQIALGVEAVSTDIRNGHGLWKSATLLAMFSIGAFWSWRVARDEWKRVAARFEPGSLPSSQNPVP